MDHDESAAPAYVDVILTVSKNAIGEGLMGGEFEFALFDEAGGELLRASNAPDGLIKFPKLSFTRVEEHHYTLKEVISHPDWDPDIYEYPVTITITQGGPTGLIADVEYPEETPGFKNTKKGQPCSLIEFPEICFDKPGGYEFTWKEISGSGGGWTTDDRVIPVIVTVTDDGYGNLTATVDYPMGFPEFINRYKVKKTCIILSAKKKAEGAPLPCGRFEFGVFDDKGNLIARAKNG